jgi:hypothetical protein
MEDCIDPLYCSGYVIDTGHMMVVSDRPYRPCTCCDCWITLDGTVPTISENVLSQGGTFNHVRIGQVPVNGFSMSGAGTYVSIKQFSLSQQAFDFWKLVRAQKDGLSSLFQPVNGKISNNWKQVEGNPGPIQGIFYASAVSEASTLIQTSDVPDPRMIPIVNKTFPFECANIDPLAKTTRPKFWDPSW